MIGRSMNDERMALIEMTPNGMFLDVSVFLDAKIKKKKKIQQFYLNIQTDYDVCCKDNVSF